MKTKTPNTQLITYLERFERIGYFTQFKVELEGNQSSYDMSYDGEREEFEDYVLDGAGLCRDDFLYFEAYNDGSVNTEITATMRLNEDGVSQALALIESFNRHIEDTDNAGMHVTVMPENPYRSSAEELNVEKLENFKREIGPVLPFIQLLGQSSFHHRGVSFCRNVIGHDKAGYPAINIQSNRRIEFRFFHPCYDKPDMLHHYLEVISLMLEYYENPTKKLKLHGGTGTFRQLLESDVFERYTKYINRREQAVLPQTLAFSDIFNQFTGMWSSVWKESTGFQPKSLNQIWASKEYKQALTAYKTSHQAARKRLGAETALWLAGTKDSVYDSYNKTTLAKVRG